MIKFAQNAVKMKKNYPKKNIQIINVLFNTYVIATYSKTKTNVLITLQFILLNGYAVTI